MLCEQIPELEVVKAFNNSEIFLKELPLLDYDLCILDIEMPGINGLQIANLLNGKPIIFTTAYKEYAAEAFDLDAIDYVQKPIKKERLQQAITKAYNQIKKGKTPKAFIQLNTDKGKAILFFEQIAYITTANGDSRDKTARMQDGSHLTLKNISFEKLLKLLPSSLFVQVNKKEIISLKNVQFISHDEITTNILLSTGKPMLLSLSEAFKENLITKLKH